MINVSALPASAGRSLRATFGGGAGSVLMNAGLAPGVTTIVAADLLRHNPDAGELEIVFTLSVRFRVAQRARISSTGASRPSHVIAPRSCRYRSRSASADALAFAKRDAGWLGGIAEGRVVRQYICITERRFTNACSS